MARPVRRKSDLPFGSEFSPSQIHLGDALGLADHVSGEGARPGAALWGSLRGAREGGGVRGECGSETLPPVPHPDCLAIRGGARRDVGPNGCGSAGVVRSRRTHEGWRAASRPAVGCGARGSRTGARDGRWERPDLSVSAASGPSAVRHVTYEAATGPQAGRSGDRSRVPECVSGLVCGDRAATGDRRGRACPHWRGVA